MEALLASVILPAIIDLIKGGAGAIGRKFLGISVEDQIKLEQSQTDKLKALAELDNPHGTPSQWVVDTRAIYRYIAATALIATGGILVILNPANALAYTLIEMPFGFIFGERMWLGFKGNKAK